MRWLSAVTIAGVFLLIGVGLVLPSLRSSGHRALTKRQYEQQVRTVYAGIQRAFRATNVRTGLAARVAAAQTELRRAAHDLEQVEPPRDVRGENLVVAQGFREYADDLEIVRTAASQGDATRISAFNKAIPANVAVAKIAEAAEEMKGKGYRLGPIAKD